MKPTHKPPPFGEVEPIADRTALLADIEGYYGIPPEAFARFRFWVNTTSGSIWLSSKETRGLDALPLAAVGLLALRAREPVARLSNGVIRLVGTQATRNVLELDDSEVRAFMSRSPINVNDANARGYRIARWRGDALGRGIIRGGEFLSELPRSLRVPIDAWD